MLQKSLRPMDARQRFGTKRTSRNVRSLVAIGGKRTRQLRAPTSEFDPQQSFGLSRVTVWRLFVAAFADRSKSPVGISPRGTVVIHGHERRGPWPAKPSSMVHRGNTRSAA
jgi:hypothetical protein